MVFSKYCSKFGPLVNAYFYEVKYVGKKNYPRLHNQKI